MMSIKIICFLTMVFFMITPGLKSQEASSFCCSVIDIRKDSGSVLIRNHQDGWISAFRPSALEFAEISIGDSIDASLLVGQVRKVKDRSTTYPLFQPDFGAPCCEVTNVTGEGASRTITARTNEGDSIRFVLPDSLARNFGLGSKIYTSPSHGFAMVLNDILKDSARMLYFGFPLLAKEQD